MGEKAVSTAFVIINNDSIPIVPNTLKYTEGFGEYKTRAASGGGGQTETVFSENAELKISKVMFELYPTPENIKLLRAWKANLNNNVIEIQAEGFNRVFTNSSLANEYEVEVGADTTTATEWESDPAS